MPPAAAPISAPFQPPARAPMPAPPAAPPRAPTAVLSPGVAHAARSATRGAQVRNFRIPTSFMTIRWFFMAASSTRARGPGISASPTRRSAADGCRKVDFGCAGTVPAASVAALVLEIRQVRRGHAHAEAAHHADHESEPDGRGAVLVEEARRRIREALRALEGVDGHFVEERNAGRAGHVHVLQLAAQVDGELDDGAAILPQVDGAGRIALHALVLDARHPEAAHRLFHPVHEAGVTEAAAIEQRLVALFDAAQIVVHRPPRDGTE